MTAAGYLEYESAAGHVLELRRSPFPTAVRYGCFPK